LLTIGGGALTALQFLVHAIAGFYCAALFGFAQGSSQVLKATVNVALNSCHSGESMICAFIDGVRVLKVLVLR